jgi:hypothetical protein
VKKAPEGPKEAVWTSGWASILERYPDVRKVIEMWPSLPEVMRKGIVGMVIGAFGEE